MFSKIKGNMGTTKNVIPTVGTICGNRGRRKSFARELTSAEGLASKKKRAANGGRREIRGKMDTKYHKYYPFKRFCKITVPNLLGYLKLACIVDPQSYAGFCLATEKVTQAGQVGRESPDEEVHPGPSG
ncbi:hypothetical protein TNCV_4300541 [Trichonephila clavipes]|nr:hypothetical protein TNCV_4300541 [Trichonephila clavipes]